MNPLPAVYKSGGDSGIQQSRDDAGCLRLYHRAVMVWSKVYCNRGLTTGELTSMFSYIMSILMSLMMLSMVFVMITMSMASGRRISEVLNETPDIVDPPSSGEGNCRWKH